MICANRVKECDQETKRGAGLGLIPHKYTTKPPRAIHDQDTINDGQFIKKVYKTTAV